MRRVLMLAYFYPPIGGGGVQRSAKFAKYLPEFGWQPYIISTTESVGGEGFDESLLADVPGQAVVWRVPTPKAAPLTWLTEQFPLLKRQLQYSSSLVQIILKSFVFPLSIIESPPMDPFFWWSLRILPLAWRIIVRERIDLIYTSSSPWSVLLAGVILKFLTGKPWVADFRDPWTHNDLFYFYCSGWRRRLDVLLEPRVLALANRVITAWPMEQLREWRRISTNKSEIIFNGFDATDFGNAMNTFQSDTDLAYDIHILFLGTVYSGMIELFFEALAQLSSVGNQLARLSVLFVGDNEQAKEIHAKYTRLPVPVTFAPRVSHPEAIELMHRAQVLLLAIPQKWVVSGRVFEYLASSTPILAVAPENGIAAKIVRDAGVGCVVDPTNTQKLTEILYRIATNYEAFRSEYFHPRPEVIQQFERKALTGKLAKVFDSLVKPVPLNKVSHPS